MILFISLHLWHNKNNSKETAKTNAGLAWMVTKIVAYLIEDVSSLLLRLLLLCVHCPTLCCYHIQRLRSCFAHSGTLANSSACQSKGAKYADSQMRMTQKTNSVYIADWHINSPSTGGDLPAASETRTSKLATTLRVNSKAKFQNNRKRQQLPSYNINWSMDYSVLFVGW